MIYMNQAMINKLIKNKTNDNKNKAKQIVKNIVDNTILKAEMLLYDKEKKYLKSSISLQWIKDKFQDFTGYENSINEICYNQDYFSDINIFYFINKLNVELKKKFCKEIVLYLSFHDLYVDIRFHIFRSHEGNILNDNLDLYEEPIICMR